jgi:hypothetical protein
MKYFVFALLAFAACDRAPLGPLSSVDADAITLDAAKPDFSSVSDLIILQDGGGCSGVLPDGPGHCAGDLAPMCADFHEPCTERPCCVGAVILKCCSDGLCQVNCP